MTADTETPQPKSPRWVGHPIIRYPTFALLGMAACAGYFLDGDAQALSIAAGCLVLGPVATIAAVHLLRGTIQPAGNPFALRASPVAAAIAGLAFTFVSAAILIDVFFASTERSAPVIVCVWCAMGLIAAALFVEAVSRTESWPDRWRAPYQRAGAAGSDRSHPTTTDPATTDPTTTNPSAADPSAADPATADPTTTNPSAADPATTDPTTADPTMDDPSAPDPTTADPSTGDAATVVDDREPGGR